MQRDQDEARRGDGASGHHEIALAHARDEDRHRQRIGHTADREGGDQESRNRGAGLAYGKQQQCDVWKQSVDEDRFKEHRDEAYLGARIGEDAAEIAITAARLNGADGGVTTPRKAKNAAIVTIDPNNPRIANTPRQPSRSPMTPAMDEPTRLPVRPTASSRPIATWR